MQKINYMFHNNTNIGLISVVKWIMIYPMKIGLHRISEVVILPKAIRHFINEIDIYVIFTLCSAAREWYLCHSHYSASPLMPLSAKSITDV